MNLGGVEVERQMHAARCAEVGENDRVIDDPRLENHRRLFYNEPASPISVSSSLNMYLYEAYEFVKWIMRSIPLQRTACSNICTVPMS